MVGSGHRSFEEGSRPGKCLDDDVWLTVSLDDVGPALYRRYLVACRARGEVAVSEGVRRRRLLQLERSEQRRQATQLGLEPRGRVMEPAITKRRQAARSFTSCLPVLPAYVMTRLTSPR